VRRIVYRVPVDYRTLEIRGGRAEVTLHDGFASQGYKTGYQVKPTRWLQAEAFTVEGKRFARQCWRYSGKRYGVADAHWKKLCSSLAIEGCRASSTLLPPV